MCRSDLIRWGRALQWRDLPPAQAKTRHWSGAPQQERVMESFLEIFDIYLLEAVVNGILLGGLLALLALG